MDDEKMMKQVLTASLMRDMSKESSNFTFIVISGTGGTEIRVRAEGVKKSLSGIEALPGTVSASLINNPIEEVVGHDICHGLSYCDLGCKC